MSRAVSVIVAPPPAAAELVRSSAEHRDAVPEVRVEQPGTEEAEVQEAEADDGSGNAAAAVSERAGEAAHDAAATEARLIAIARETIVFAEPRRSSKKLGYLRLGASVRREAEPAGSEGCPGGWYRIAPAGFVCAGNAAALDAAHPLTALAGVRAERETGLPYVYGRSKPTPPPLYTHLPGVTETRAVEGAIPSRAAGWDDFEPSPLPSWLTEGRSLPEPLGYARKRPSGERAFANSGFALLRAYEHAGRRFGLTTDLELVPLDRLTRVPDIAFRGLPLDAATTLPVVFARSRGVWLYEGSAERGLRPVRTLAFREAVAVEPESVRIGRARFLRTRAGGFLREDPQLTLVRAPDALPAWAKDERRWLHVSIGTQTLIAYAGARPVYVTLVSTGADGLADPAESHATPRGEFVIHTKHLTATMDSDELGDEYDLRDVPYVQYFSEGYALHAAYWHDAFGTPRSHGCVNLSPADARWLFHFTEPAVPRGFHGAFSDRGTLLSVTP